MDIAAASSSSSSTGVSDIDPNKNYRRTRPDFSSDSSASTSKSKQKQQTPRQQNPHAPQTGMQFDMLQWYPNYLSCQRYFVNHSQHDSLVQAFAAFINILLPFQRDPPIYSTRGASSLEELQNEIERQKNEVLRQAEPSTVCVSLIPYIRRLVATGMDAVQILHGFFGNDWEQGIGPQRETERRNLLLTARSVPWPDVKRHYDISPYQTLPFLRPLTNVHKEEIDAAERSWSEWEEMISLTTAKSHSQPDQATFG